MEILSLLQVIPRGGWFYVPSAAIIIQIAFIFIYICVCMFIGVLCIYMWMEECTCVNIHVLRAFVQVFTCMCVLCISMYMPLHIYTLMCVYTCAFQSAGTRPQQPTVRRTQCRLAHRWKNLLHRRVGRHSRPTYVKHQPWLRKRHSLSSTQLRADTVRHWKKKVLAGGRVQWLQENNF